MHNLLPQEYDFALLQIVVDNARSPAVSFTASAEQLPALHPCQGARKTRSARPRGCATLRQGRCRWISENTESSLKPLHCPVRRFSEAHDRQNQQTQVRHHKNDNAIVCGKDLRDSKPRMPSRCLETTTMGSPSSVADAGVISIPRGVLTMIHLDTDT